MTVQVDIAPELFVWAIDRAGWDDQDIERKAPKFYEWVRQETRPTFQQVQEFADATCTPLGALFLPKPPEESLPLPDMRTVGNKKFPRPSANLLDTIYVAQNRQGWYKEYAADYDLPKRDFVGTATLSTSPLRVAIEIRERLSFDMKTRKTFTTRAEAFRTLIDRIEDLGVLVMVSGFVGSNTRRKLDPEEFRGFAIADVVAPLIFVNGADTKSAQIFTLVHELAHIWLGHSAIFDATMMTDTSTDGDLWCYQVATEVLAEELNQKHEIQDEIPIGDHNSRRTQLGKRFSSAVVQSARSGYLPYRDAYKLLGITTHSEFEAFAHD